MFYKGAASKMRYTRVTEDIPIRLSYGEEFFIFLTFHIVPYLRTIMAREQCKLCTCFFRLFIDLSFTVSGFLLSNYFVKIFFFIFQLPIFFWGVS